MGLTLNQETQTDIFWTEYGIPIRNLWYMILYSWNEPPIKSGIGFEDIEDAPTLDVLLALVLIKLVQQRLRIGLGHDYQDEKKSIRGIRGRIDFNKSLKNRTFERGQAFCEFQNFCLDVPKNQIIRTTLVRLIQIGSFGPDNSIGNDIKHRLRWLTRAMEGINLIELKLNFIHRQQLGRNDRDYKLMLAICELLLLRQMPTESAGHNRLPTIERENLVMHSVYEKFIANFYKTHLSSWLVKPQTYIYWTESNSIRYLPSMQPDLVLIEKSSKRMIVLDTKFTKQLQVNQWGNDAYHSSHLYQLYAYLKTQENISEMHRNATGILLYPAVGKIELTEPIKLQEQKIRIECVDLTSPWEEIELQLLELVSKA